MQVGDMVTVSNRCTTHKGICNAKVGLVYYIDNTLVHPIGVRFDDITNATTVSGLFYFKEDDLLIITAQPPKKEDSTMLKCNPLSIKNVYFNYPVTVVMWNDGTKTIVRCSENDFYDPEKGLAMAIIKKVYGNDNSFHKIFKKWIPEEDNIKQETELKSSSLTKSLNAMFRSCTACKHKDQTANMDPCYTCSLGLMHPCFEPVDSEE